MKKEINANIINEIVRHVSKKRMKDYLGGLLSLSKESVYRRIYSHIPFTLDEIQLIANDLNVSIDRLIGFNEGNSFHFSRYYNMQPADAYCAMLTRNIKTLDRLSVFKNVKITAVLNHIPFYLCPLPSLFKLDYFHYLYSTGSISFMDRFSETDVPAGVVDLQEQLVASLKNLPALTCITDTTFYSNIIHKIQYFYRLNFLISEDVRTLQMEMYQLMEMFENLLRKGQNSNGVDCLFYYSFLNLESSSVFIEYADNSTLELWIYPGGSPLEIHNSATICDFQRQWIDFKMRNSILITKTNDLHLMEILRDMQKQIAGLA
jgi:hypothetical protein